MGFLTAYYTDKGIRKNTNQDALLIKTMRTAKGDIGLFMVCDGMGGLEQGELASGTLISRVSTWFEEDMTKIFNEDNEVIVQSLNSKILEVNSKIVKYSIENGFRLGTTVTAFLCIYNKYYIIQVGDSRVYEITDKINLLTKDQTFVEREVDRGNITKEEAKVHKKRNLLLQCIGINNNVVPVITEGVVNKEATYMICSDGLHHKLTDEELVKKLGPKSNYNEASMEVSTRDIVELVKSRNEKDNITVILAKSK